MASVIVNKRQQARNERALQDMIRMVPGNDRCADCNTRNPGWTSWSLGIFLCMRCAAIHRKLGTHISKVKSLSMDTWTADQVEHMKRIGNAVSNKTFNPRNVQPNLPLDADEIDMAMEKFIREKYQKQSLSTVSLPTPAVRCLGRNDTGSTSTSSSDDRPPPVPAKNTPHFSTARAASSTYSGARIEKQLPPVNEDYLAPSGPPPTHAYSQDDKKRTLKNLGFVNDKRNSTVLKGVNGSVDKAVEALVRLGEGGHASETLRSHFPVPQRPTHGPQQHPRQHASSPSIPEPNDGITSPAPDTNNPFGMPEPSLESSFQNLQVSHQQTLFPNNTGTFLYQNQQQNNPFLKTFITPISPSPYHHTTEGMHQAMYAPDNLAQTNPFLRTSHSQQFHLATSADSRFVSSQRTVYEQPGQITVPVASQWSQPHRSFSQPQYSAQQTNGQTFQIPAFYLSQTYSTTVQSPLSYNTQASVDYNFPQAHQMSGTQQPKQTYPPPNTAVDPATIPNQQQQYLPVGVAQSHPQRHDKASILALYSAPQLEPTPASEITPTEQVALPQRSASVPLPLLSSTTPGNNPFVTLGSAVGKLGHIREESRDFSGEAMFGRVGDYNVNASGRYSPDAFANLSARLH